MTTMLQPKSQRFDLEAVAAAFLDEYTDVVRRLTVGDPVDREEARRVLVSVGVSMRNLRADVDKLRRRMQAAAELEEVQAQRSEAKKLDAEAEKLAAELTARRRAFEDSVRAKYQRLLELQERSRRMQSGTSTGTQVRELRAGAKPAIQAEIQNRHRQIHLLWKEAGELREKVPRLELMANVATEVREQFSEFQETGRFFSRKDKQGQPLERLWAGKQPLGTPPDQICVPKAEERVQRFEAAVGHLTTIRERITVGIPGRIRELEVEIEQLAATQLDPMAMAFGVENDAAT